jgi:hypothetical protein
LKQNKAQTQCGNWKFRKRKGQNKQVNTTKMSNSNNVAPTTTTSSNNSSPAQKLKLWRDCATCRKRHYSEERVCLGCVADAKMRERLAADENERRRAEARRKIAEAARAREEAAKKHAANYNERHYRNCIRCDRFFESDYDTCVKCRFAGFKPGNADAVNAAARASLAEGPKERLCLLCFKKYVSESGHCPNCIRTLECPLEEALWQPPSFDGAANSD